MFSWQIFPQVFVGWTFTSRHGSTNIMIVAIILIILGSFGKYVLFGGLCVVTYYCYIVSPCTCAFRSCLSLFNRGLRVDRQPSHYCLK
jgi:hypothetical protein